MPGICLYVMVICMAYAYHQVAMVTPLRQHAKRMSLDHMGVMCAVPRHTIVTGTMWPVCSCKALQGVAVTWTSLYPCLGPNMAYAWHMLPPLHFPFPMLL